MASREGKLYPVNASSGRTRRLSDVGLLLSKMAFARSMLALTSPRTGLNCRQATFILAEISDF